MAEKTRLGVVGTGYLGRLHTRVLTEMPEVELVGFVETRDEVAAEVESSLKVRRWKSVAELSKEIEGAVVATPTIHHAAVSGELIDAGVDVMIEKPITANAGEARQLIKQAAAKKRIIQVGHVERYNPAIVAAAPALQHIRFIEADRIGVFSGRSLDIDVLLDLMIHDLHMVLSITRQKVVAVQAIGVPVLTEMVDMANVRLELEDGGVANITASRVANDRVRKVRFFGSDVYVSVDTKEQAVHAYRLEKSGGQRAIKPLPIEVQKKEPLRAELESFVESVRTRKPPLVPAEEGLAALELALRVREEIESSLRRFHG